MSRLPIQKIITQFADLNEKLAQNLETSEMIKLSQELKRFEKKAILAKNIDQLEKSIEENEALIKELNIEETDLMEMLKTEIENQKSKIQHFETELLTLLAPEDERDESGVILEIRAGAGGDESGLFAVDMLRMYGYLCDKLGFSLKVISESINDQGGYKEAICEIEGEGAFSWFKYEGGVHRVQRVPTTEKQGRIHTSTVAVAIMPLIKENDSKFKLDPKEIEITTSTAGGNGGQSVNTTYSAVRMKHIPTGIEAQSQDQKNQIQNRIKCLEVLTSRVFAHYEEIRLEKEMAERNQQVGKMDRSEKIRTYNFPQDRITDHRYNLSWNQLPAILDGEIIKVIQDIKSAEAEIALKRLND